MGNTNCASVPCMGTDGTPGQSPIDKSLMRKDKHSRNSALSNKQRNAMRNSLSIPAGDYDSLLLHERIAKDSVKGVVGMSPDKPDARTLINGGMYEDQKDMAVQIYSENLVGYDLPISSFENQFGTNSDQPVSLHEAFSGHVNTNDYKAYKDKSLRGSMRESRASELRSAVRSSHSQSPTNQRPLFDRSLSLLEFTIQSQIFTRQHQPPPIKENPKSKYKMSTKEKKRLR